MSEQGLNIFTMPLTRFVSCYLHDAAAFERMATKAFAKGEDAQRNEVHRLSPLCDLNHALSDLYHAGRAIEKYQKVSQRCSPIQFYDFSLAAVRHCEISDSFYSALYDQAAREYLALHRNMTEDDLHERQLDEITAVLTIGGTSIFEIYKSWMWLNGWADDMGRRREYILQHGDDVQRIAALESEIQKLRSENGRRISDQKKQRRRIATQS
jgi:hypothetical protein